MVVSKKVVYTGDRNLRIKKPELGKLPTRVQTNALGPSPSEFAIEIPGIIQRMLPFLFFRSVGIHIPYSRVEGVPFLASQGAKLILMLQDMRVGVAVRVCHDFSEKISMEDEK